MHYEAKVTTQVSAQIIQDNIVSAFEGGSNYWLQDGRIELVKPTYNELGGREEKVVWYGRSTANVFEHDEFEITIDVPDDELHTLNREAISNGLSLMAEQHASHFLDLVREEGDAGTADLFLQLCLFGEVVYG